MNAYKGDNGHSLLEITGRVLTIRPSVFWSGFKWERSLSMVIFAVSCWLPVHSELCWQKRSDVPHLTGFNTGSTQTAWFGHWLKVFSHGAAWRLVPAWASCGTLHGTVFRKVISVRNLTSSRARQYCLLKCVYNQLPWDVTWDLVSFFCLLDDIVFKCSTEELTEEP